MRKVLLVMLLGSVVGGCARLPQEASPAAKGADAAFARLAEEYIADYLAWRPQTGTSLGFHQYDGKATDYRRASLDAELARLKSFEARLAQLDTNMLSPQSFYDYRLLRGAIQREEFAFEPAQIYSLNPMTYATALDVNIYIKRN